jgi:hypothetical protein
MKEAAFYCEHQRKCRMGEMGDVFTGIGWGEIPPGSDMWRIAHDKYCGGKLIPLYETPEQAQNEIDALQRRLTEYASEVQRLRDQGRECYVEADSKSMLNALEECRTEREKLKEGGKQIAEALLDYYQWVEGDDYGTGLLVEDGIAKARELGLLEDK